MMRWFALILASLSWLFAFRYYVSPDPFLQWGLIGLAVAVAAAAFREEAEEHPLSPRYLMLLIPLGIALLIAAPDAGPGLAANHFNPWLGAASRLASSPYRPALVVLTVGVIVAAGLARVPALRFLSPAGMAASLIGGVLVLQSPAFWLCTAWTSRNPEAPGVSTLVYYVLEWVGSDVSLGNGILYVRSMRDTHEFPLTWDHLAIFPLLVIWLGGALLLSLNRSRRPLWASLPTFTGILICYAIARLIVLVAIFVHAMMLVEHESEAVHVEIFWLPWITAVSFLPLIPVLGALLPWRGNGSAVGVAAAPLQNQFRSRIIVMALASVACAALVMANSFWDPGVAKRGRVLIDEAHSQWERTDTPYDTDWYGHESGYNYYCMAQYLRHYYQTDFNMQGLLTPEKLAQYDVLILKTPTELYTPAEIDAIEGFVRNGGGLFALGEHTNVFGSSSCLNPVTRRFGLAFRYDVVFDIERKWEQTYFPPRLGRHPAILGVPFFRFAVSCSLQPETWKARPVFRSTGVWSLPIDYCPSNFYPTVQDHSYAKFGAFDQMGTTTFGKGRVAAFTDSTVYSNFLAFYPGKPELLLGTVEWLNRTNRWNGLTLFALGAFVVCLMSAALLDLRLRPDPRFCVATLSILAGVSWVAMWGFDRLTARAYAAPSPRSPVTQVVFEMQHGDYELPVFSFPQKFFKSYEVFYQYVLRLGYYTTIAFDLKQATTGSDPIVIIRPVRPFNGDEIEAVDKFLRRGGSLLVLDSPSNTKSTADELLKPFGLNLAPGMARGSMAREPISGSSICRVSGAGAVSGGTPLLVSDAGEPVVAVAKVGSGQIVAAGLSDRFNDMLMGGGTRTLPDRDLRAAYELEFELMRGLASGDMSVAMRRLGQTYAAPTTQPASTQAASK